MNFLDLCKRRRKINKQINCLLNILPTAYEPIKNYHILSYKFLSVTEPKQGKLFHKFRKF